MRQTLATIAAVILLAGQVALADEAASDSGPVVVPVSVLRADGTPSTRLSADDFRVTEDGVPCKVTSLGRDDAPIDAALLLDTSASTGTTLDVVREAAAEFADRLRPDDSVAVIGFSSAPRLMAKWSSDRAEIRASLAKLEPTGETWFYQATSAAIRSAFATRPASNRRVLVILTDGVDNRATLSAPQIAVREALARDVTIHVVAVNRLAVRAVDDMFDGGQVPDGLERDYRELQSNFRSAEGPLGELAARTGGRLHFPDGDDDISDVYARIAGELRARYVIAYVPRGDSGRGFHALRVSVRQSGLRVYARDGYVRK